jgi:hypothetical protein
VLDNGTVFFDTEDPLVGADINGMRDVYAYQAGRPVLISRGILPTISAFVEATSDGSDVFLTTNDQLVSADRDTTVDMYDARVGGGIPEPSPPDAPCAGDECRPVSSGPMVADKAASEHAEQTDGKPVPKTKTKVSVLSSSVTSKVLRLVVRVSHRGRLRVSGGGLRTLARVVSKPGKYTLNVALTAKTRAALKGHHKAVINVKVALASSFAPVATVKFKRTLGK